MMFLLDTDHISILQKQSGLEYTTLIARIVQVPPAHLALCIKTVLPRTWFASGAWYRCRNNAKMAKSEI
jgi:tRNA(fMet)-specific endonuclease VapC